MVPELSGSEENQLNEKLEALMKHDSQQVDEDSSIEFDDGSESGDVVELNDGVSGSEWQNDFGEGDDSSSDTGVAGPVPGPLICHWKKAYCWPKDVAAARAGPGNGARRGKGLGEAWGYCTITTTI